MPAHSPPSPALKPTKRPRQGSYDEASPTSGGNDQSPAGDGQHDPTTGAAAQLADKTGGKPGQSSNFRNVSACNRCRLRKNRCDQKLPSCASCAKAGVACVGYDPITKKEIPRRYVVLAAIHCPRLLPSPLRRWLEIGWKSLTVLATSFT